MGNYNVNVKGLIVALLLLYCLSVYASFYIGDNTGHTVQAGESVYLYNTGGLSGYSIDFDKSSFSTYSIITQGNRIFLGTLKGSLPAGRIIDVYFSTEDAFDTLHIQITPELLGLDIPMKHISWGDSLKGTVMFRQNAVMTGSGIDSLRAVISHVQSIEVYINTIFSIDLLIDFDYASGFFPFSIASDSLAAGKYNIDIIMYSSGVADTLSNTAGFHMDYSAANMEHVCIIYSDKYSFINDVSDFINKTDTEILDLYSNDIDWEYIINRKYVSVIAGQQGEFFNDSLYIQLRDFDMRTMIFLPYIDSISALSVQGKPLDSMIKADFFNTDKTEEPEYLRINSNENAYTVYDSITMGKNYMVNRGNINYCFFIPMEISADYINRITEYYRSMRMKALLGDFYTVEFVDNDAYNNYCVEIFTVSGHLINRIEVGHPGMGRSVMNISKFSSLINGIKSGLYYFRLLRGDKCEKQGLFINNP